MAEFSFRNSFDVVDVMVESERQSHIRKLSRGSTVLSALRYTSHGSNSKDDEFDKSISVSSSSDSTNSVDSLFKDSTYFSGEIIKKGKKLKKFDVEQLSQKGIQVNKSKNTMKGEIINKLESLPKVNNVKQAQLNSSSFLKLHRLK